MCSFHFNTLLTYLIRSSYTLRCRCFFFILIILRTVGLLGWVIRPSQGLCLNTGQHEHRINTYTYHPCLVSDSTPSRETPNWMLRKSRIRFRCWFYVTDRQMHDPGFQANEDTICHRPLSYRDRPILIPLLPKLCALLLLLQKRGYGDLLVEV
jgi:hypothetical protein